jgi:hypothetical protein
VIPAALGKEICQGTAAPLTFKNSEVSFGCDCSKTNKILTFPLHLWLDIANIDRGEEWGGASSVGRRHPKEVDACESASPSGVEEASREGCRRSEAGEIMAALWPGGIAASKGRGREAGKGRAAAVVLRILCHGCVVDVFAFVKVQRQRNDLRYRGIFIGDG